MPKPSCAPSKCPGPAARGWGAPPSGTLPVKADQMDSLLERFRRAPDPRHTHTRYRIGPGLTLLALALLAGRCQIAAIARFAPTLTQAQRRRLNLPRKQGTKRFSQVPGHGVFYPVLPRGDAEAFARWLTDWLQARADSLPAALALDGQMIRDHLGLLTLARHQDGAPRAVALDDQKAHSPRCEQTAAAALLAKLPALDGQLLTADPLHGQRPLARALVDKGGDYLAQIKGNQPKLLQHAQKLDALVGPPLFVHPQAGHGRLSTGRLRAFALEPLRADFPSARSLLVVRSPRTLKKTGQTSRQTLSYLSSREPADPTPAQWPGRIRGHRGGVEGRHHWRRDAGMGEDGSRSRHPTLLANLALLRSALLAALGPRWQRNPCPNSTSAATPIPLAASPSSPNHDFKKKGPAGMVPWSVLGLANALGVKQSFVRDRCDELSQQTSPEKGQPMLLERRVEPEGSVWPACSAASMCAVRAGRELGP